MKQFTNRDNFWSLLERAKHDDTDEMLQNLTMELATLSPEESMMFRGYFTAYMEHVNDCVWVDMACKVINGYVSDDTGLYFALWLIAQGEKALYDALMNPDSLAELAYIPFGYAEFEMLMSVGMSEEIDGEEMGAVMQKCAEETESYIAYKGGSKYGDYDDFDEAMEDIPNMLPNLIARAQKEGFDWKGMYEL